MSEMHPTDLHAWLAYRDELASRVTVADRVVRNVEALTSERPVRGARHGRTLLVVAAMAVLLLAGIGLPRALLRHHASVDQFAPAHKPQGVPDRLPPAGIDVVWVPDPSTQTRLIALDRSGRPVGWMPLVDPLFLQIPEQSSDGQRLLLDDYGTGGRFEMTAQGRRIELPVNGIRTAPNATQQYPLFFSDDDRSLCMQQGFSNNPNLVVLDAEGHVIHSVSAGSAASPSYLTWRVATCSVRNDVAVFIGGAEAQEPAGPQQPAPTPTATSTTLPSGQKVQSVGGLSVTMRAPVSPKVPAGAPAFVVRVVRLSTGAELARRNYADSSVQPIDASNDGTMVQELHSDGLWYTLRDIRSGVLRGTLHSDVRGLVGDYFAAVQDNSQAEGGTVTRSVVDMRTGRVAWIDAFEGQVRMVYPDGGGLAIAISQRGINCPSSERVDIVDLLVGTTHAVTLDTCPAHAP